VSDDQGTLGKTTNRTLAAATGSYAVAGPSETPRAVANFRLGWWPPVDGAAEGGPARPKFGHDEASIALLSEFLKRHYGDAQDRGETTNREKAKKAAENEFRAEIDWKTFYEAFRRAKIVNQGGRPKKPAKNS
jgi:hypothetical protein